MRTPTGAGADAERKKERYEVEFGRMRDGTNLKKDRLTDAHRF